MSFITASLTGSVSQLELPGGSVTQTALANGAVGRSQLAQVAGASFHLPMEGWRVHASTAVLPTTAAADDLGLASGAYGTNSPSLLPIDFKAASTTAYARQVFQLPPTYDAGETITIDVRGGMNTTIADGYCWADIQVVKLDGDGAVGSDLCTTVGSSGTTSINSLTKATKTFAITASGLSAGDLLDIRLTLQGSDTATGTVVKGEISKVEMKLDIRG